MVSVAPISFTSAYQQQTFEGGSTRREKIEDAASLGGAGVAGGAAVRKSSVWKQFGSASKAGKLTQEAQQAIRTTTQVVDKTNTLLGAFRKNAIKFKGIAMDFADGFKSAPVIKNVLHSKAYQKIAGGFGYTMAAFVFLSGVNKAASVAIDKTGVNRAAA